MGFFYFRGYELLDVRSLQGAYVRTAVNWGEFEPAPGRYDWSNREAKKIEELLARGFRVLPSIRAKSDWAVADPSNPKASSPPKDLDHNKPLQQGQSYSDSYFAFVASVVKHYRGKLDIVVIENEMNDRGDFWAGTIDEYLRLFLTAQAAIKSIDRSIEVADGGIQGAVLNQLVVDLHVRNRNVAAAQAFVRRFSGTEISVDELLDQVKRQQRKEAFQRAGELVRSDLYRWVDRVNFHYYQNAEGLPEVLALLRHFAPAGKPIMTNEIGIKERFLEEQEAAKVMVKKFAILLNAGVRPVVWFTVNGKKDHNGGALVDDAGQVFAQNFNAFQTIARCLGRQPDRVANLSGGGTVRLQFGYGEDTVDVIWEAGARTAGPLIPIPANSSAFSFSGRPVGNSRQIAPAETPAFLISRKARTAGGGG